MLTNELYTICRTGDVAHLDQVVDKLRHKFSALPSVHPDYNIESPEMGSTLESKAPDVVQNIQDTIPPANVCEAMCSNEGAASAVSSDSTLTDAQSERTLPNVPSPGKSESVANLNNDTEAMISADQHNSSENAFSNEESNTAKSPVCNNTEENSANTTPQSARGEEMVLSEENRNTNIGNNSLKSKNGGLSSSTCENEKALVEENSDESSENGVRIR